MLMIFPYSVGKNLCDLDTKLQKVSVKLFKWFHENDLKTNQDKFHFLSSLGISTKFLLPASILENSDSQKHLGIIIDTFSTYVMRQAEKFKHSQEFPHMYPKHKNDF